MWCSLVRETMFKLIVIQIITVISTVPEKYRCNESIYHGDLTLEV